MLNRGSSARGTLSGGFVSARIPRFPQVLLYQASVRQSLLCECMIEESRMNYQIRYILLQVKIYARFKTVRITYQ